MTIPHKQGLYDPQFEHENCGIGLIVDMKGRKSHDIVQEHLKSVLIWIHRWLRMRSITGDGAGIFIQTQTNSSEKFYKTLSPLNCQIR